MSIRITTEEVHQNRAQNHYSRWHEKGASPYQPNGRLAFQRLRQPLFVPDIRPAFTLRRKDKLFAIGSCFARGIESALVEQEMAVLSRATEFDSFPAINNEMKLGFTNKYSTFSIYNELRWALDPAEEFPRESLVDIEDGVFYDPHTNPALQLAGLKETIRRRKIIEAVTRRVGQCRVVIVTLGLVEVWRDKIANVFINTAPIPAALHRHSDRYEFHITNFTENFSNLEHIHSLLSRFGHPDVQLVVTVSPVPLEATFSSEDVVIANTYSKSILRAAAQEWATTHKNVHYFPSYEIVQNSDRKVTWEEDLRHVKGEVVYHIMNLFLRHYFAGPPATELSASPNPVPAGGIRGKTTISWSSDSPSAAVYVSKNGAEEKFFASGSHGSEEAHWIQTGATYEFSLYSGRDRNTRLARISVTRAGNDKSDTLRTTTRSKKHVSLAK
jgi:GSCFA family.